ncbi:MAG: hypothetical protein MR739_05770 [Spirochaetia bacterium]|nr:hypothetical protein [Spirochaetia bacterium]
MPGFEIIENSERDLSRYRKLSEEPSANNENNSNITEKKIDLMTNIVSQGASIINKGLDIASTVAKTRAEGQAALDKAKAAKIEYESDAKNFVEKTEVIIKREKQRGEQVSENLERILDKVESLNGNDAVNLAEKTFNALDSDGEIE